LFRVLFIAIFPGIICRKFRLPDFPEERRIGSGRGEPKYLTIVKFNLVMVIHYEGSFLL
jgi:hypothetical protein